jgi:hypothetical protein
VPRVSSERLASCQGSQTGKHRDIEKFGVKAQEMWKAFDSDGGWTGLLYAFAKLAES